MKVFSPAKINLYLEVHSKREDGFHELTTIMQPISWGDWLEFKFNNSEKIVISTNNLCLPCDHTNLVWQAIDLFYLAINKRCPGIMVDILKHIPLGSGLGGGSSNAVATLKALNSYHHYPLNREKMINLIAKLGSDTVFFYDAKTAVCQGRGEIIKEILPTKKWHYLLIVPDVSCLTKEIFGSDNLILTNCRQDLSLLSQKLNEASVEELECLVYNSLKQTVCELYPQIKELIKRIEEETSKRVFISGSGSTLFMIFEDDDQASQCQKFLEVKLNSKVKFFTSETYELV